MQPTINHHPDKYYSISPFVTDPIGAKRNIYIDREKITNKWILKDILPHFIHCEMFYYWLDYTTALQMIHKYSLQYTDNRTAVPNNKAMVIIINYNIYYFNQNMYGIIVKNDKIFNDKCAYKYKLISFMNKQQIFDIYSIYPHDLPLSSRKNPYFLSQLKLNKLPSISDICSINWNKLHSMTTKSTKRRINRINNVQSIVICDIDVLIEYCKISLNKMSLIPILIINKNKLNYFIEWILIVHLIHKKSYCGLSFRYNYDNNTFNITNIYLDSDEIRTKHKLVGLSDDYAIDLNDFSLKDIKFMIDDDVDADGDNDNDDDDEKYVGKDAYITQLENLLIGKNEQISFKDNYIRELEAINNFYSQLQQTLNPYPVAVTTYSVILNNNNQASS